MKLSRLLRVGAVATLVLGSLTCAAVTNAATPACVVQYTIQNDWGTGATVNIGITNNSAPMTSWTLGFAFPGNQKVSSGWNGTYTQSGQNVSVASMSYNGALGTGASTSTGFNLTYTGTDAVPTAFTLNGTVCNNTGGGGTTTPTVSITSPAAGQTYTAPATVAIAAAASETGGTIGKVEFYNGSTLLGTDTTSPYSFSWAGVAAGSYSLTAKAYDAAGATATSTAVPITVSTSGGGSGAAPQLHVSGNKLVSSTGATVTLHGVNRSGGEFACVQGNGIWDGPMDQASVAAIKAWHANAVRVPLNEACWNAESYVNSAYAGATYQQAVKDYVSLLNSNGLVAILDLHWTDGQYTGNSAGCSDAHATCQKPMPDAAQAVPFWSSVATTFKGNNAVVFDLFNEPYPERATGDETTGWQCWKNGGTCNGITYQVAGMQTLVTAVRNAGATNVIMLGGLAYSNDLTQWLTYKPTDPSGNLVASHHSYNFNSCSSQSCWTSQLAPVIASVPLVVGELGENDCGHSYIDGLTSWLDSQQTGYLAWTWNTWDCSSGPSLISDYTGTPTAYGAGSQAHLASLG